VIFVTVGTHQQPFERLLEGLSGLGAERCVVQHGHGSPPSGTARAVAFMPFDEVQRDLETCEVVITHAGVGSILAARRLGHLPVVVPRMKRFGEHVDDHQAELTRALASTGQVLPAWDIAKLPEIVASVPPRRSHAASPGRLRFASALRTAILAT
jgi:UDP-N-acetylglucosamine transferase subunit ALG13